MEESISAYVYIFICVLYVYKRIFIYLCVYMYSASSLWYVYTIYIVFIRTLSFAFKSALLLINRSAISVYPYLAALIRAVDPSYIYIYIYTYKNVRYRHSKRGKHT